MLGLQVMEMDFIIVVVIMVLLWEQEGVFLIIALIVSIIRRESHRDLGSIHFSLLITISIQMQTEEMKMEMEKLLGTRMMKICERGPRHLQDRKMFKNFTSSVVIIQQELFSVGRFKMTWMLQ